MREWALDRWPESTQVALASELPALKAEIRMARERAMAAAGQGYEECDQES